MNISQICCDFCKQFLFPIILIIFLFMHNCNSLNRTKRTIGIFRRPDKLEAVSQHISGVKGGRRERTRFYLYTRLNAEKSQELTVGNEKLLFQSRFNPELPIKFIINGWLDNRFFAKWVRSGINALLYHGDYNVIYVGWESIQELFMAAFVIKLFSEDLAQFIIFLKNIFGINGEVIHCIGHSLGGSLCAFAGSITYIGRVTALDNGPRAWFESKPESERINRWQAGFVDVIHSDFHPMLSWGMTIPIGDVDFYPNQAPQPGCFRDKFVQGFRELRDEGLIVGAFQWIRYLLFCSHYRSHEWFFESIWNKNCTFIGVRCSSYQRYLSGQCGCDTNSCAVMGIEADRDFGSNSRKYAEPGKWFIKTSDFIKQTGTHCLFQYQINVQLGKPFPTLNGTIVLTIHSTNDITQEVLQSSDNQLYPGLRLGKLAVRPKPIININKISMSWTQIKSESHSDSVQMNWISIKYIKFAPILISNNQKSLVRLFCSSRPQINPQMSIDFELC